MTADFHILLMRGLKFSLSSKWTPKRSPKGTLFICLLSITIFSFYFLLLTLKISKILNRINPLLIDRTHKESRALWDTSNYIFKLIVSIINFKTMLAISKVRIWIWIWIYNMNILYEHEYAIWIYIKASSPRTYAVNFAIKRPCGIQLKAFDKPVNRAPTTKLLSTFILHFSINQIITYCKL